MKKLLSTFFFVVISVLTLKAAYFENIPRTLIQPNGDTLHCFITGDEFYHYLHDADGYTIVQDSSTGYFVYAAKEDGKVVPTAYVAGRVSPASVGLTPHVTISSAEWRERRDKMMAPVQAAEALRPRNRDEHNHGRMNNLVVFIRFLGDPEFSQTYSEVEAVFNDTTEEYSNSLYNYFKHASYNQFRIFSYLYPESNNDTILYYQDEHPRFYYEPYSVTNPIGYDDENESDNRTTREMELLVNAINYVAEMIPEDLNIDYNNDGFVDNVCFLVQGDVGDWNDLLWPHRWALYLYECYIHDKRVWDFNFELSDNSWYFSNSTLCHEMSHSLGMPDLYHYSDTLGFNPVGSWDLMAANGRIPQQSGAFMKYYYANWIPEIPEITQSGRYNVRVMTSPTNERLAYKIQSENDMEYFVFEARKKIDYFDQSIYNSGLLIYRINEEFNGNASWDGETCFDQVYIYRPGGTTTQNGDIDRAAFRQGNGHTRFDYSTDPQPFLTDGYISMLRIYDIHSYLDSVSFSYLAPGDTTSLTNLAYGSLHVYPNPANDIIHINLPVHIQDSDIREAALYDLRGRKITDLPKETVSSFSTNNYPPGLYTLKIGLKDGYYYTQKVQITH